MWCTSCRQDVPGLVDGVDSGYSCARCGAVLLNDSGIDLSADAPQPTRTRAGHDPVNEYRDDLPETIPFEPAAPPQPEPSRISSLRWDAANWELSEKLRHVERLTATPSAPLGAGGSLRGASGYVSRYDTGPYPHAPHYSRSEAPPPSYEPTRFEPYSPAESPSEYPPFGAPYAPPYQPLPAHPHSPLSPAGAPPAYNRAAGWIEGAASLTSWLFLGLAVGTFCCGGFLAGWGAVAKRPELEQVGMPIILGGMLAMVLGLLPQIFLRRMDESRTEETRTHERHAEVRRGAPRRPETDHADGEAYGPHADYGRREARHADSAYYR
jgi:hypothetical protein